MVSRGSAALSAPPASITETISATSITVTASASTSVPNGSPTRCATTSAWYTAACTAAISATAQATSRNVPPGHSHAAPSSASGQQRNDQRPTRHGILVTPAR